MINITIDELLDQIMALDGEAVKGDREALEEADALGRLMNSPRMVSPLNNMTYAVQRTHSLRPVFLYGLQVGYRLAEARYLRKLVEGE